MWAEFGETTRDSVERGSVLWPESLGGKRSCLSPQGLRPPVRNAATQDSPAGRQTLPSLSCSLPNPARVPIGWTQEEPWGPKYSLMWFVEISHLLYRAGWRVAWKGKWKRQKTYPGLYVDVYICTMDSIFLPYLSVMLRREPGALPLRKGSPGRGTEEEALEKRTWTWPMIRNQVWTSVFGKPGEKERVPERLQEKSMHPLDRIHSTGYPVWQVE